MRVEPPGALGPERGGSGEPGGGPGGSERPGRLGQAWAVGDQLVWGLGAGLVLLVLGTLGGRPDVAVLGVAPTVGALWAVWVRPRGQVWADVERVGGSLGARLHLAAPPGTESVRLRVSRPGHGATEALVDVPLTRELDLTASSVRTGPQPLFTLEHQGIGPASALTGPTGTTAATRVLVLPSARPMPGLPLPSRLRGLSGQHESRRPGEGGGLRDVHPFVPGDSLRWIDWKVTARRSPGLGQLYVRRSLALAEAVVTLVVDSRDDIGPDPATWSGMHPIRPDDATSLDLARQAAATVAQGYLGVGDRVGVEDLGARRRAVRPGAGRRQLDRVVHQLALLRPEGDPPRRLRPPQLPSASLVYLFSTFLDPEAAQLAVVWRRTGHRVIAVDVLPRVRERGLDPRQRLALRIVRIEREDRLAEVAGAGGEVIRWADGDRAAARIQQLARMSHRRPGPVGGR